MNHSQALRLALDALGKFSIGYHVDAVELNDLIATLEAALEKEPVAWLYPEGLEALKNGKCWTAYGTKQDAQCSIPVYLNGAVAQKVEPAQAECAGFDSQPASQRKQPEQEPVAWLDEEINCAYTPQELDGGSADGLLPLYTHPPRRETEQEPVDTEAALRLALDQRDWAFKQLQAQPDRREWRGLTEKEHEKARHVCRHVGVEGLVLWLEDKLKERNA